jgi:hypothetical protein
MQFIRHGPDIPEALLQAHEDGQVVFFCGAGISYPAGLKGFEWLVSELYERAGEHPDEIEADLLEKKQFDQTIGRLENRIQGGRLAVRRHLPAILRPDLGRVRALTTHLALLTLARHRRGEIHLVTTNFDSLFEKAARKYDLPQFTVYPDAPARATWEGLVYLHGRVQEDGGIDELDRLILSDGDFGQAYLTQAWAARFISGLFQNHTVCFVGYSINDPVLRYMTAAHALASGASQMFAFAPFTPGDEALSERVWRAKNVNPILYEDSNRHRGLHRTLHLWASVFRDRSKGKERVVARAIVRRPDTSSSQNDFVGRLLWALSDPTGLPVSLTGVMEPPMIGLMAPV